jgi:hypothetical protein
MNTYADAEFADLYDRDSGRVIEDMRFERCRFVSCALSMTIEPDRRAVVRNIDIVNCSVQGSCIEVAQLEEISVRGLRTIGLLQAFGAVFRRVVLQGRIGRIMLSPLVHPAAAWDRPDVQARFRKANAEFYRHVDWAVDVSQADAVELELTGVPGRLVRRDSQNSILVTAEALRRHPDWRSGIENTAVEVGIRRIVDYDLEDVVLVACRRSKRFAKELALFDHLRRRGVAEPD